MDQEFCFVLAVNSSSCASIKELKIPEMKNDKNCQSYCRSVVSRWTRKGYFTPWRGCALRARGKCEITHLSHSALFLDWKDWSLIGNQLAKGLGIPKKCSLLNKILFWVSFSRSSASASLGPPPPTQPEIWIVRQRTFSVCWTHWVWWLRTNSTKWLPFFFKLQLTLTKLHEVNDPDYKWQFVFNPYYYKCHV
jgi:hypothetical protein